MEGFLGFEQNVAMFQVKVRLNRGEIHPYYLGRGGRAPSLRIIPWHLLCNRKGGGGRHVQFLSQGSRNVPVGMIQCVYMAVVCGKIGEDVDTDLHTLGNPGERSVGVYLPSCSVPLFLPAGLSCCLFNISNRPRCYNSRLIHPF